MSVQEEYDEEGFECSTCGFVSTEDYTICYEPFGVKHVFCNDCTGEKDYAEFRASLCEDCKKQVDEIAEKEKKGTRERDAELFLCVECKHHDYMIIRNFNSFKK